ncbi:hypothetical protein EYF80_067805 [Liparis tanakae]|uniref:Secreted protein n=1 Tax=Liparis tanakae TaxID=230148 RepID=A0A4Z2E118_9TELE|nr:hypothetical protein EYF80_067805 [Liparis tanakae]
MHPFLCWLAAACSPVHLFTCSPVHLLICSPVHLFTCSPVRRPDARGFVEEFEVFLLGLKGSLRAVLVSHDH